MKLQNSFYLVSEIEPWGSSPACPCIRPSEDRKYGLLCRVTVANRLPTLHAHTHEHGQYTT